ncbi:MAG TPA: FG-GAP-like repeat-containing protein, partial [Vicinamibacterales bacterium]|nr:FG-GAP-like repeat-containing protein [Vicinamibacterales bacterium]
MTWRVAACVLAAWVAAGAAVPRNRAVQPQPPRERLERAYAASNRGVALLEQFDYTAAAEAFRQALAIEPSLGLAHLDLAIALLYAGDTAAAAPEARAAAQSLPDAPQPPYILGLIARADNRTEDAEAAFQRVLRINPADAGANVNLGQLLLQERKYPDALAAFRAAVAAEPYNATAAYGLATALTRSGDTAAGQAQMARFRSLRDSPYAVTYTQGYLQQGRYGEALASTGAEPGLVDRASPAVRFVRSTGAVTVTQPGEHAAAQSAILFDADGDGDLDLLSIGGTGGRLLRNENGRFLPTSAVPGAASADERIATAGDYDNAGRPDLFIAGPTSARLLHQRADGTFEDVTARAGLPRDLHARAASWVDVDHDGDLDLVTAGPVRLLRNNGNGTFTDITNEAGLTVPDGDVRAAAAVVPTDYDNRRDVDLMILSGGGPPRLFRNMRDGTFKDVAAAAGLPQDSGIAAVAAADVNKDGFIDFFFGRGGGSGVFAISTGRDTFVRREAPASASAASLAQFLDYDNDGLLDLLLATPGGPRLLRNVGDAWVDETTHAGLDAHSGAIRAIALGDVDRDGDTDAIFVSADASTELWRNDGGNRHGSLTVALAPRVSNRSGLGAKVEIRAGGLRQMLETSAASPATGPADLVFGLGPRSAADVVRVLWPSGILQSELAPKSPARVEELDRKPSSCPYLYTWNGARFEFVTDFLGGGEMGDWEAPGQFDDPDPDEYVRIPDGMLQPRANRYELRITNELEEAMFLDRVRLIAVDHPADVQVYPNEGLKDRPRPPHRLFAVRDVRVPDRAVDEHGHDVRPLVAKMDRRWPADFPRAPIGGYAAPHTLTLDLGPQADRAVLLMTGWTSYAFSTDNVAASQAGLLLQPPILQVRDASGGWQTADANVGFPVGRPQTIAVDLAGRWLTASREVRIVTNMPIYWDQVLVGTPVDSPQVITTPLEPLTAALRWRGFSAEVSPDGREPFGADYERVSTISPWKA